MEWIAHCTVCGELDRAPNGAMMESLARIHRRDTGHMTIVGHEPSIIMSGGMIEVKVDERELRPFPDTYSDWVDLGLSIKDRSPDVGTMAQVNTALTAISEDQPSAEEAKRWLMSKARELGIS